jgi:hypothetical protein
VRYLGLALFAEGPTDYRFLSPVLQRATVDLCRGAREEIEVGGVLPLEIPSAVHAADPITRVLEAARAADGEFDVLFLHRDGAGDPDGARAQWIEPAAERIAAELTAYRKETVAVVPVRKMEAWALADGDALRAAFSTRLADAQLGIPSQPREVERILDPKLALDQAYQAVVGSRRRARSAGAAFLEVIARQVRLEQLRLVPAFRRFEQELRGALRALGYLPGAQASGQS